MHLLLSLIDSFFLSDTLKKVYVKKEFGLNIIYPQICGICGQQHFDVIGFSHYPIETTCGNSPVRLEENKFEIRECRNCFFRWKSPQLSPDDYFKLYASSDNIDWHINESSLRSRRLKYKVKLIEEASSGHRVLDIGCFRGDFLQCFGSKFEKFGIEPSDACLKACARAGIKIIGKSIEDLQSIDLSFDVVTMIDVIEHLDDPVNLLIPLVERLEVGGLLVIETGDMDSLLARVMGIDWHYYSALEHISFYCEKSLRILFQHLGLINLSLYRWPHIVRRRWHVLHQWHQALRFKWPFIRPRHLFRTLVHKKKFPKKEGAPPWLTGVKDHIFIIGKKI